MKYLILLALLLNTGCATHRVQLHDISEEIAEDGTIIKRTIKTDLSGTAWFSSAQGLAKLKALQTDKTQSFGGHGIVQHGATNTLAVLHQLTEMLKAMPH